MIDMLYELIGPHREIYCDNCQKWTEHAAYLSKACGDILFRCSLCGTFCNIWQEGAE